MSEYVPKNLGKIFSRNQSMMAMNIDSQDGDIVGIDQGAVTIASTTPNPNISNANDAKSVMSKKDINSANIIIEESAAVTNTTNNRMENQTQFNNLNSSITKAMLSVNNANKSGNQSKQKPPKTPKKKGGESKSMNSTNSTIVLDDQNLKLTAKSLRDLDKKNTEKKNSQKALQGGQPLSEPNIEDIAIIRETLAEELD